MKFRLQYYCTAEVQCWARVFSVCNLKNCVSDCTMGRIQSVLLRILSCLIGSFSDRLGNFCSFISHKNGKLLYSMSVVAIQIVFDFSGEPTSIIVLFAGPAVVLFAGPAVGPGCGVHHCSFCRSSCRTGGVASIIVLVAGPAGGPGCGVHHCSFCRSSRRTGGVAYILVLVAGPVGATRVWCTSLLFFADPAGGPGCGVHHCSFCRSSWRTGVGVHHCSF